MASLFGWAITRSLKRKRQNNLDIKRKQMLKKNYNLQNKMLIKRKQLQKENYNLQKKLTRYRRKVYLGKLDKKL